MRIMISCGEASGDLYAGALAKEIRLRAPDAEIVGFGGPRLQAAGATLAGDFTGLTVTGLAEAVRVLPRSYAMLRRLVESARTRRPDVFVAVDFPDFNFRLMAALRRLGIPIVYYVAPQLWAWRPGRMKTMKHDVDQVLVIFPFEAPLYERAGVPVQFVGHPLVDLARTGVSRSAFLSSQGLRPDAVTVAVLPGSRPNELSQIGPVLAAALPMVAQRVPGVQYVVAAAPGLPQELFAPFAEVKSPLVIVRDRPDDVLAASDIVITASGTATVQAAIHGRPMVVVYRLSPLTYHLGKRFLKVNMYAMPNLVAGRRIVPELIQDDFTPARVADEAVALLTDRARHASICAGLREVRDLLGAPGATGRAAEAILQVVNSKCTIQ